MNNEQAREEKLREDANYQYRHDSDHISLCKAERAKELADKTFRKVHYLDDDEGYIVDAINGLPQDTKAGLADMIDLLANGTRQQISLKRDNRNLLFLILQRELAVVTLKSQRDFALKLIDDGIEL